MVPEDHCGVVLWWQLREREGENADLARDEERFAGTGGQVVDVQGRVYVLNNTQP